LNDVIDAQLSKESQSAGNCLGLTVLYNCLLKKIGIAAGALYLENAFGKGPHVLTLLRRSASPIDIENSLPDGFDYQGHLDDPSRTKWGERELVADIYHSLGNELFLKGNGPNSEKRRCLFLNPGFEKAALTNDLLDKMEVGPKDGLEWPTQNYFLIELRVEEGVDWNENRRKSLSGIQYWL
jgi:hypothetical protein